jgi:hypothetical protein
MKTEQPVSYPDAGLARISRVENQSLGTAQKVPLERDTATHLNAPTDHRETRSAGAAQKWKRGQTYRFVLISCGLFWIVAALAVWGYVSAH